MKLAMILTAGVLAAALTAGNLYACDGCKGKGNTSHVHGTIAKIDGAKVMLKANDKDGKPSGEEIVFDAGEKTSVTVDGAKATAADLKPGMPCWITPRSGTAAKIVAKAAGSGK